jgi:ribonuclease D
MDDRQAAPCQLITRQEDLAAAVEKLAREKRIAVDLEADSMFHFREKVCLLQLASRKATFVIDTLQVTDLAALKPVMADAKVRKLFHGADYDVRSLYRDFGIEIQNLFDTELGSRFLGLRESGLDAVLRARFQIELNKQFQRKDWSRRPLPAEMIAYAAGDVAYLLPLASQVEADLKREGRLSWVLEECEALRGVRPQMETAAPLYLSFRGAGRLHPRHLALLENLLQLRRKIAAAKDRPLFKVFANKSLLALAQAQPATVDEIRRSGALSPKQIDMYGAAVLRAQEQAHKLAEERLPRYPRQTPPRLPPDVPAQVAKLKAWRDAKAQELGLDAGLLLNKTLIQAIAVQRPENIEMLALIPDIRRWRCRAFGREIVSQLEPRRSSTPAKRRTRRRRHRKN